MRQRGKHVFRDQVAATKHAQDKEHHDGHVIDPFAVEDRAVFFRHGVGQPHHVGAVIPRVVLGQKAVDGAGQEHKHGGKGWVETPSDFEAHGIFLPGCFFDQGALAGVFLCLVLSVH